MGLRSNTPSRRGKRKYGPRPKKGADMLKASSLIVLLVLAACSGVPQGGYVASPCSTSPGGYECQVQRYMAAP